MSDTKPMKEASAVRTPVKLADYRILARRRISREVFHYIDSGACDELTKRSNRRDFDNFKLLPLCLRDVSKVDLSIKLLGKTLAMPIGVSPTALHKLVHEHGEVATARASKALDIPMIVSSMSSVSLEMIAQQSQNTDLWFQAYIFKDRGLTKSMVERAAIAGYKAIVLTIGTPVVGKRDRSIANKFALPDQVLAANFQAGGLGVHANPIHAIDGVALDDGLTWRDLAWLRSVSRLPVIVKGLINPLDVAPALDCDVSGIIVSNHGGRQLDTTESTVRMLSEIASEVSRRVPVLIDGGVRRGTDVLKAIALGADSVLLGRSVLWALAVGGEQGVKGAIHLLADELRTAMQIVGCCDIETLRSNAHNILRQGRR